MKSGLMALVRMTAGQPPARTNLQPPQNPRPVRLQIEHFPEILRPFVDRLYMRLMGEEMSDYDLGFVHALPRLPLRGKAGEAFLSGGFNFDFNAQRVSLAEFLMTLAGRGGTERVILMVNPKSTRISIGVHLSDPKSPGYKMGLVLSFEGKQQGAGVGCLELTGISSGIVPPERPSEHSLIPAGEHSLARI